MTSVVARLLRNVLWLGTGEALMKAGLFVVGVVVARGMGPDAMGAFTVGYGAALVLLQVMTAGQAEVLIRETARLPMQARALLAGSHAWQNRVALMVVPVAAAATFLVRPPLLRWTLLLFIPYVWLRARLVTAGAVFKGLDRMEVEVGARAVELGVLLVATLLIASLGAPVWATGLAFGAGAAAALATIGRPLRRLPAAERAFPHAVLAREGSSFMGISVANLLLSRTDTFLLAGLGIATATVGYYGTALSLIWGLVAIPQLLAVAMYPTVSRAASAARMTRGRILLIAVAAGVAGLALAATADALAGPVVRGIFGVRYDPAVPLFARLAWSLPGSFVGMLSGISVASFRRQRWSLALRSSLLVAVVAANLAVIPRFGALGSAGIAVAAQTAGGLGAVALALLASRRVRASKAEDAAWGLEP